MANSVADFIKTYLVIAAILVAFSAIITVIAHASFLYVTMLVFLWGGLAYILSALLAWTGFANLYRYSPTLFVGSRSYRREIFRGDLLKEGRDDGSLLIGLAFGGSIIAVGAVLWNPLFILVDGLAVGVVALFLRMRTVRRTARS